MIAQPVAGITGVFSGSLVDVAQMLYLLLTIVQFVGWWKFSLPDPAYVGTDNGSRARVWIRGALIFQIVAYAVAMGFAFFNSTTGAPPAVGANALSVMLFVGLGTWVAWAIQFYAAMLYLRWLSPRLPDPDVHRRATRLMWLGPLLVIVGSFCFMIGPLIALVMYWNVLDLVRRHLKAIRAKQGLA